MIDWIKFKGSTEEERKMEKINKEEDEKIELPIGYIVSVPAHLSEKFEMNKDWEEYFTSPTGVKYIMRTQKDCVKIKIK